MSQCQVATGFKVCLGCEDSHTLTQSDPHTSCLTCLGWDHDPYSQDCEECLLLTDKSKLKRHNRLLLWKVKDSEKCPSQNEWDKWKRENRIAQKAKEATKVIKPTGASQLAAPPGLSALASSLSPHSPPGTGVPHADSIGGFPYTVSMGHGFPQYRPQLSSAAVGAIPSAMRSGVGGTQPPQPRVPGAQSVPPPGALAYGTPMESPHGTPPGIHGAPPGIQGAPVAPGLQTPTFTPDSMVLFNQIQALVQASQQQQAAFALQQQELAYLRAKVEGQEESMVVEEEDPVVSKETSTFNNIVDTMVEALDLPQVCRSSQYVPTWLTCETDRPRNIPPKLPLARGMWDCIKNCWRMPTRYATSATVIPQASTFGRYRLLPEDMGKIGAFRSMDPDIAIHCKLGTNEDTLKVDTEEFKYVLPRLTGQQSHVSNLSKSTIQSAGAMLHMCNYARHGIDWQLQSLSTLREAIAQLPTEYPIHRQLGSVADNLAESITLQSQCNVDLTQQSARNLATGVQQIRRLGLDQTSWTPASTKPLMELPIPSIGKSEGSPIAPLFGAPLLGRMTDLKEVQVRSTAANQVLGAKRKQPNQGSYKPQPAKQAKQSYQMTSPLEYLLPQVPAPAGRGRGRGKSQPTGGTTVGKGRGKKPKGKGRGNQVSNNPGPPSKQ